MADNIRLVAQVREERGSGPVGRLRRSGKLPGVVNTASGEVWAIQLDLHGFEQMLRHHVGENLLADLDVAGKSTLKVLLKDVQHESVSGAPVHVDFIEISMTKKLTVSIAIELVGDAPGVVAGGVLEHTLREVEVECLPGDLVESIDIDVSGLSIGDHLSVGDIQWNPALTILTPPHVSVCAVAAPRVEEEAEPGAEEEGAEPAVIGRKADEDEKGEQGDSKA